MASVISRANWFTTESMRTSSSPQF
jgi:hypothetical protein